MEIVGDKRPRESGAEPITNSAVGARLVRIMAEGLIAFCDRGRLPYPQTLHEFEQTLVQVSRVTGFQGGLSFTVPSAHQEFYRLLGMDPALAGVPHSVLAQLAQVDPSVARGLALVSAFGGAARAVDREHINARAARIFREFGGPDFELLAKAFGAGDCQRDLVFNEMRIILEQRQDAARTGAD